jgi:hypothetical protein
MNRRRRNTCILGPTQSSDVHVTWLVLGSRLDEPETMPVLVSAARTAATSFAHTQEVRPVCTVFRSTADPLAHAVTSDALAST